MQVPVRDYLIVKQFKEEEQTESGLFIPQENLVKRNEGVITKMGETCSDYFQVGMAITFKKQNYLQVSNDEVLIQESDILMYDDEATA